MLPHNEGALDRVLRLALGIGLGVFAVTTASGVVQIAAGSVAAIMLLTGVSGFCPLYALFGISTRRRTAEARRAPDRDRQRVA